MECGECTLCCKLLNIPETNSVPNEYCEHCNINKGCLIYDKRPKSCKTFECSWKLDNNAHKNMRPDKCGVVFDNINENITFGIVEKDCKINNIVFRQIAAFVKQGVSVVFQAFEDKPRIYLAKEATGADVWRVITDKIKELNE